MDHQRCPTGWGGDFGFIPDALFRDDVIRCSVEVNDGALTSGPVWSDAVVVRNSLPVVEGVSVGPDDVRAGRF